MIQIPCFARYYESLGKIHGKAVIAEPIVKIESLQDTINLEMNKDIGEKEYYFVIKNYELDVFNNKRVSEVDFTYNIEIKSTNSNFPVKYYLMDCLTGELVSNKNVFEIKKNIEYERKYKLVISWNDIKGEISLNNNIEVNIRVLQVKL